VDEWVYWMIAAGALAAGEILTLGFFLGPIAIAAVLAGLVALAGGGLAVQLIVFILASIGTLGVLRPIARRHLRTPPQIRTGTAALVGAPAVVVERVDADGGQVKIGGEVWSARAYDDDEVLEPGDRAHVMKIEGATALVVAR
jgi:membrane protein implicated in regulation of membrane protease activity